MLSAETSKELDFAKEEQKLVKTDGKGFGVADAVGVSEKPVSDTVVSGGVLSTAKVKQNDLIIFTTQLSVMLDSGVVLSDALDAFAEQAHGRLF